MKILVPRKPATRKLPEVRSLDDAIEAVFTHLGRGVTRRFLNRSIGHDTQSRVTTKVEIKYGVLTKTRLSRLDADPRLVLLQTRTRVHGNPAYTLTAKWRFHGAYNNYDVVFYRMEQGDTVFVSEVPKPRR